MILDFVEKMVTFLPKIAIGAAIFAAFWVVSYILKKIIKHLGKEKMIGEDVLRLIEKTTVATFLIFGAVTALGTMGINVAALVAGLGLTGFALGFALRDAISNLLSGILIIIYKPFRRNDHIFVAGFEGKVTAIDLRYTTIETEEKTILIPNSILFTNPISVVHSD